MRLAEKHKPIKNSLWKESW